LHSIVWSMRFFLSHILVLNVRCLIFLIYTIEQKCPNWKKRVKNCLKRRQLLDAFVPIIMNNTKFWKFKSDSLRWVWSAMENNQNQAMLRPFLGFISKTVAKLYIINTYLHIIPHFNANESWHTFKSNMCYFDKNAWCRFRMGNIIWLLITILCFLRRQMN